MSSVWVMIPVVHSGQAVLHTGDFRFSEDKDMMPFLRARFIHTLVLDTTYCNPQASLNVNYGVAELVAY